VLIETNSYELWPADTIGMPCGILSPSRETGGTELKGPEPGLGASEYDPGGVGPVLGGYGYDGDAWPLLLYDEYADGLGLALVDGAGGAEWFGPPGGYALTLFRRRVAGCIGGVGAWE
jgi:hypothetical protein